MGGLGMWDVGFWIWGYDAETSQPGPTGQCTLGGMVPASCCCAGDHIHDLQGQDTNQDSRGHEGARREGFVERLPPFQPARHLAQKQDVAQGEPQGEPAQFVQAQPEVRSQLAEPSRPGIDDQDRQHGYREASQGNGEPSGGIPLPGEFFGKGKQGKGDVRNHGHRPDNPQRSTPWQKPSQALSGQAAPRSDRQGNAHGDDRSNGQALVGREPGYWISSRQVIPKRGTEQGGVDYPCRAPLPG